MDDSELHQLLSAVKAGTLSEAEALSRLKSGPFRQSDLGFARPDHHRRSRHGLSEVVYGESKTAEQILRIVSEMVPQGAPVLVTRLQPEKLALLVKSFPSGRPNAVARTFIANPPPARQADPKEPRVAIVAAGTSDLPVAEEACEVCVAMDIAFVRICDVGVAGLHRLLGKVEELQAATALVVIAGMEGALPSIVAGHAGDALEEDRLAHGASRAAFTARTTWHAAKAAEKPLSMLLTVTPGAQELSMASSGVTPANPTP